MLQAWFGTNIYRAIFGATFIEGLGIPVPAELLYVAAVWQIRQGEATLPSLILTGALGNIVGSMCGYGLGYAWGESLLQRLGIQPAIIRRFFDRYGSRAVFFARFIGPVRAATIYVAGTLRLEPGRFLFGTAMAALIWNGFWATAAFYLGQGLPRLLHELTERWVLALAGGLTLLLLVRLWRFSISSRRNRQ